MTNRTRSPVHKQVPIRFNDRPSTFPVSSLSVWPDHLWRLDNPTPGQVSNLGWRTRLPDFSFSTDSKHRTICESFREVFWGMLTHGGDYGRTLKTGSAAAFGVGMRDLFRWMNLKTLSSFADLSPETIDEYLSDLPVILAPGSRFYDPYFPDSEEASVLLDDLSVDEEPFDVLATLEDEMEAVEETYAEDAEDAVTYGQVSIRVKVLFLIHAQSATLTERGLPAMPAHPCRGKEQSAIAGLIVPYVINRIPPLPDEVALPLLRSAVDWINGKAADVIRLQQLYLTTKESALAKGLSESRAKKIINMTLESFEFSTLPGGSGPWRESLRTDHVVHPEHGISVHVPTQGLRTLIFRTRDAALILIWYLVGLRSNEVCSFEGGWNEDQGTAACIEKRYSKSGIMEMFFVKGMASKGLDRPRDDEWLLGAQPVGGLRFPLPVRALNVLDELFRPWRELAGNSSLIVSFTQPRSLPQNASSVGRITVGTLLRGCKHFAFSEVDLKSLPDTSARGEDLREYRLTKGLCIRPSQGRKTYAAFMLESRSSLLSAVSEHFNHLSVDVTENAYFASNKRFSGEIDSVRISETIAFFVEAVRGKKIAGRMADAVKTYFSSEEFRSYAIHQRRLSKVHAVGVWTV